MKGGKKLFWLIVIIIIASVFIWWQKSAPKKIEESLDNVQQTMPPVDQAQLAADYKNSLRALLAEYQQALTNPASETISSMRQKLLALKLPAEFRDLHAQLVLLLDKIESQNKSGATDYAKELEEIIKNNQWLQ